MPAEDSYEGLGPNMRARLDRAEMEAIKLNNWVSLLSERSREDNLRAREICLLLSWAMPKPWPAK